MKTSTNPLEAQLAVRRGTRTVIDAIRSATSGVPKPEDTYLRNLKGDCLSRPDRPRDLPVEGMVALLYDAFGKGVPLSRLQEVPDALSAALRSWSRDTETLEFGQEWVEEQTSEGTKNVREIEFDQNPSHVTLFNLESAHREYVCESEDYLRAARMRVSNPLNVA